MYFYIFFDVNFMLEIEVIYLFTFLTKGKNRSKISQDYCNLGKAKLIGKIRPHQADKKL